MQVGAIGRERKERERVSERERNLIGVEGEDEALVAATNVLLLRRALKPKHLSREAVK